MTTIVNIKNKSTSCVTIGAGAETLILKPCNNVSYKFNNGIEIPVYATQEVQSAAGAFIINAGVISIIQQPERNIKIHLNGNTITILSIKTDHSLNTKNTKTYALLDILNEQLQLKNLDIESITAVRDLIKALIDQL